MHAQLTMRAPAKAARVEAMDLQYFAAETKNKYRCISKINQTQKDIIHTQERRMVASGASRGLLFHFKSPNCRVASPNYGTRQEEPKLTRIHVAEKNYRGIQREIV
jgi:hypothetical protein